MQMPYPLQITAMDCSPLVIDNGFQVVDQAVLAQCEGWGSGDGSLIRFIEIIKPSPNPTSLAPLEFAFAA